MQAGRRFGVVSQACAAAAWRTGLLGDLGPCMREPGARPRPAWHATRTSAPSLPRASTSPAPRSVPKRRPMDETQETLRTSAFPSTHVKEKWAKNLYIAGVAYGRTVS